MPQSRPPPPRRAPAFLIIPALLLVAFSAVCVAAISLHLSSSSRETENRLARASAKSAVLAGTMLALADLQTYAGTDDCATAKIRPPPHAADHGKDWLGAWHGERIRKEFPDECVALVSNRGFFTGTERCRLLGADVPWETLGENARVAFFIRDESLRASIGKRERDAHLERFKDDAETRMRLRQQIPRKTRLGVFFENADTDASDFRGKIAAAPDEKIFLAEFAEILPKNRREAAENALVLEARGVPADWTRRRLKLDLSDEADAAAFAEFVPPDALKNFRARGNANPFAGTPVAKTPPKPAGTLGWFEHPFPLVAELKLHLGFFNPRSDGQHRARFHVTARFWNPYPHPLLAHGDGRIGLFDAENLPPICIRNENTGGEIFFQPSDFPVGRFGLVRQTPSDRTCNAYCRIFDASAQGFGETGSACGLHGGEVFLARFPDPAGQPEGLARNTWKYQKDPAKIAKPPSGALPDAWFHPAHVIEISSAPSFFPASFLIRGDAGTIPQQTDPRDYAVPVVEFRNVAFPHFSLKISGEEYNRQKAGEYDVSQASLVWKIRLRAEDAEAMNALFEEIEPRLGVFDFSVPAVRRAFEISALAGTAAKAEAEIGGDAENAARNPSPLRDRFPNEHASDAAGAFSCIRIFDTPTFPALSAGAFRHCAFSELTPLASLGDASPPTRKISPNSILDRAYFSAREHHPHSIPAEENFLISGAFNINSENADAWAAVLPHDVPAWTRVSLSEKGKTRGASAKDLTCAFFRLPHSAHGAPPAAALAEIFSDKELAARSEAERSRALCEQSVRELDENAMKLLAETICALLKKRRDGGNAPFRSLEEFADSGILKTVLSESGLNRIAGKEIPAWQPSAISQSALLESLASGAAPRGDTFTIFCRAEVFHPISKKILGSACAEMRVQRMPEFFDAVQPAGTVFEKQNAVNRAFGRRFRITAFRWLPHDEL